MRVEARFEKKERKSKKIKNNLKTILYINTIYIFKHKKVAVPRECTPHIVTKRSCAI